MLTHISIENFKGIRDRVEIELKPITLLFGPNSAGKSTILHALLYAQEVFERHNLDADTTATGGRFINLGGFGHMVHGQDLDRAIKLGFRFTLDDRDFSPYEHDVAAFEDVVGVQTERIINKPTAAGVTVTIRWSNCPEPPRPVVESCLFQLDGLDFAEIAFDQSSLQRRLRLLAVDHPLFHRPERRPDDYFYPGTPQLCDRYQQLENANDRLIPFMKEESPSSEGSAAPEQTSIFHVALAAVDGLFPGNAEEGLVLPLREYDDALPRPDASAGPVETLYGRRARDALGRIRDRPGRRGKQPLITPETEISMQRVAFDVAGFLDKTLTNILNALRIRLRGFRYLGPMRDMPPPGAPLPRTPDPSSWATGLGAWYRLQSCDAELIDELNRWLSDPERLGAGVTLLRKESVYVKETRKRRMPAVNRNADKPGLTDKRLLILPNEPRVELTLHDVGVGISQLVPVLVTALDSAGRVAGIEEPEYHLHPRLQAELGDLLIESAVRRNAVLLAETHSEHLLLRLLRRVRETAQGTLPEGCQGLKPDRIAVVCVESVDGRVRVTRLHVTEDGDFAGSWPEGFFDERAKELF